MKPSARTTMLARIRNRRYQQRDHTSLPLQGPRRYSAAVPAQALDEQGYLIDQLIRFAFDILGAQHVDLHVDEA